MFKIYFKKFFELAMKALPIINKLCVILRDEARNTIIFTGIGAIVSGFLYKLCKKGYSAVK